MSASLVVHPNIITLPLIKSVKDVMLKLLIDGDIIKSPL